MQSSLLCQALRNLNLHSHRPRILEARDCEVRWMAKDTHIFWLLAFIYIYTEAHLGHGWINSLDRKQTCAHRHTDDNVYTPEAGLIDSFVASAFLFVFIRVQDIQNTVTMWFPHGAQLARWLHLILVPLLRHLPRRTQMMKKIS